MSYTFSPFATCSAVQTYFGLDKATFEDLNPVGAAGNGLQPQHSCCTVLTHSQCSHSTVTEAIAV